MKKQFLENKILDELGNKLLESANLPEAEIEKTIANPQLFAAINAQIKREQLQRKENLSAGKSFINLEPFWPKFALAASGILLILIAFLTGLWTLNKKDSAPTLTAEKVSVSQEIEITSVASIVPSLKPDNNSFVKTSLPTARRSKITQKKIVSSKHSEPPRREASPKIIRKTEIAKNQEAFYPLNFAGELNNSVDERSVVQAELSADDLVKLGYNLPLEREEKTFKTELIVSSDGMPLAVRFVKHF